MVYIHNGVHSVFCCFWSRIIVCVELVLGFISSLYQFNERDESDTVLFEMTMANLSFEVFFSNLTATSKLSASLQCCS